MSPVAMSPEAVTPHGPTFPLSGVARLLSITGDWGLSWHSETCVAIGWLAASNQDAAVYNRVTQPPLAASECR